VTATEQPIKLTPQAIVGLTGPFIAEGPGLGLPVNDDSYDWATLNKLDSAVGALTELSRLAYLLDEHSIIAGGAVRDIIAGNVPRDIDLFVSSEGLEAATARSAKADEDAWIAKAEAFEATLAGDVGGSGYAEGVDSVETIGAIQVIHVDDPWARVMLFDATCNMVWLDSSGAAWAASQLVLDHIKARQWVPNPLTIMTQPEYTARRLKFLAKGWSVPEQSWPPQLARTHRPATPVG